MNQFKASWVISLFFLVWLGCSGKSTNPSSSSLKFPGFITASAISDLNGDGLNDLVLASQGGGGTSPLVLLNQGANSFQMSGDFFPAQYKAADGIGVDIKIADFNGDGLNDILMIVVDGSSGNFYGGAAIQLFLGNEEGGYSDASSHITDGNWPRTSCDGMSPYFWPDYLRVADLDLDGSPDFIATSPGNCGGVVFLNDGTGSFAPAVITVTQSSVSQSFSSLRWWKSSLTPSSVTLVSAGDVLVGDLDQDGKADLFAPSQAEYQTHAASNTNAAFINHSSPGNLQFTVILNPTESALKNGELLDVNGDGYLDFVGSQSISASPNSTVSVIVMKNDGTGNFTVDNNLLSTPQPGVIHARQFLAADLNGDGRKDLLISDHGFETAGGNFPGARNWLLINQAGKLFDLTETAMDLKAAYTHQASIGDLDADGYPDIFLNNADCDGTIMTCENQDRWWRNDGTAGFESFSPEIN